MIKIIKKACNDSFENLMNSEECYDFSSNIENDKIEITFTINSDYGIYDDNSITINLKRNNARCYLTERYEACGIEDEIERLIKENIDKIKKNLVTIKKYNITILSENSDTIPNTEEMKNILGVVLDDNLKIEIE